MKNLCLFWIVWLIFYILDVDTTANLFYDAIMNPLFILFQTVNCVYLLMHSEFLKNFSTLCFQRKKIMLDSHHSLVVYIMTIKNSLFCELNPSMYSKNAFVLKQKILIQHWKIILEHFEKVLIKTDYQTIIFQEKLRKHRYVWARFYWVIFIIFFFRLLYQEC